jgi:hypothetical protein
MVKLRNKFIKSGDFLESLSNWVTAIKNNYILVISGAIIFFAFKSYIGYVTYRKFSKDLEEIKSLIRNQNAKD